MLTEDQYEWTLSEFNYDIQYRLSYIELKINLLYLLEDNFDEDDEYEWNIFL